MLGLMCGMYVAAKGNAHNRRLLAQAGQDLARAMDLALANAPDTPEHQRAWLLAESALRLVTSTMHWNASLTPVEAGLRFRINGTRWQGKR